jgi:hypothetical protein
MSDHIQSKKIIWLLYADTNTRFNLMSDECFHLQQTIDSFLPEVTASAVDTMRGDSYYFRPPQERALESLLQTLGALESSIQENKKTFADAYKALLNQGSTPTENLYWFLSLRGHFLSSGFNRYLKHIQHAHEKLVQYLENMPGTLPSPTLMRRWSSAGYGEFLSEYSRSVNWEIQKFLWGFCDLPEDEFTSWRSGQVLVHAWSHEPTSMTRVLTTQNKETEIRSRFTTIWSSYFYLEQPILFPLMYHECAHHFANVDAMGLSNDVSELSSNAKLWLERPRETAHMLHRLMKFQNSDQMFWQTFVTEIWADAIGIALCGNGFLSALAIQLIGTEEENDRKYSDYSFATDEIIPLGDIGKNARKIRGVPFANFELGYFWEARLKLAVKVYKNLYIKNNSDSKFSDSIIELIDRWVESGAKSNSVENTSTEHNDNWKYREKLNLWAEEVVWDNLSDFITALNLYKNKNKKISPSYPLNEKGEKLISQTFNKYTSQLFPNDTHREVQIFPKRLEDICIQIRWNLAKNITKSLDDDSSDKNFEKWGNVFADFMRNDGSVAYRLGLEWSTTRRDVVRTAGSLLHKFYGGDEQKFTLAFQNIPNRDRVFLEKLYIAINKDAAVYINHHYEVDSAESLKIIADLLVKKQSISAIKKKTHNEFKGENLSAFMRNFEDDLYDSLIFPSVDYEGEKTLGVGTFSFGVLRPTSIALIESTDDTNAFNNTLIALNELNESVYKEKIESIKNATRNDGYPEQRRFFGMLGEYGYAQYEGNFTPVEKDYKTLRTDKQRGALKTLSKPRAVLTIARSSDFLNKNPEKSNCHDSFFRISQIGFQYRWQVVNLRKALIAKKSLFKNFQLMISSAWEDVVIITEHENMSDYFNSIADSDLELVAKKWQDIHTGIGVSLSDKSNEVKSDEVKLMQAMVTSDVTEIFRSLNNVSVVADRTGRYDLSITWNTDCPITLFNSFNDLPIQVWSQISSMATSLYGNSNSKKYFVSQIILRHDT